MAIQFSITPNNDFDAVSFTLTDGVCSPADLADVSLIPIPHGRGVVLTGRGPVWLFATLAHHFHPTPFVATFDPRLGGGVVVQSHSAAHKVGDIIPMTVD